MACPRAGNQIQSSCPNVSASKNKMAAAIMPDSRPQGGSPQTNVCHHCVWSDSPRFSQTPHVTQVVLLTASLCCFEFKILLCFAPDKTDVSPGYRSLNLWGFELVSGAPREDVQCVPRLIWAGSPRRREQSTRQRGGSCWFTGAARGFPHPFLPFNCGSKYWEDDTTDSKLLTSVIIYWHTTTNYNLGEQERLGVATWHGKWQNSSKTKSKKGNSVCASFRQAFRALR